MLKALLISTKAWYSDRCLMIWKTKVSKANVLLFQLQASVHGIKEKGSGSSPTTYPTPTRGMYKQDVKDNGEYARRIKEKGHQIMLPAFVKLYPTPTQDSASERTKKYSQGGMPLPMAVKMFPTPTAGCVEGGEQSSRVEMTESGAFILRKKNKPENTFGAKLSDAMLYLEKMYPTPRASVAMVENMETIAKRNKYNSKLEEKVAMEMYSTPTTNDAKNLTFCQSQKERSSIIGDLMRADKTKHGGKLNPHFVEFLMGFPMNWTKIDPTE
jgi:hypothetical protein